MNYIPLSTLDGFHRMRGSVDKSSWCGLWCCAQWVILSVNPFYSSSLMISPFFIAPSLVILSWQGLHLSCVVEKVAINGFASSIVLCKSGRETETVENLFINCSCAAFFVG